MKKIETAAENGLEPNREFADDAGVREQVEPLRQPNIFSSVRWNPDGGLKKIA